MKWFGKSWDAPVNRHCEQADVPVGEWCEFCGVAIREENSGFVLPYFDKDGGVGECYYHRTCMSETILGPNWRDVETEDGEKLGELITD